MPGLPLPDRSASTAALVRLQRRGLRGPHHLTNASRRVPPTCRRGTVATIILSLPSSCHQTSAGAGASSSARDGERPGRGVVGGRSRLASSPVYLSRSSFGSSHSGHHSSVWSILVLASHKKELSHLCQPGRRSRFVPLSPPDCPRPGQQRVLTTLPVLRRRPELPRAHGLESGEAPAPTSSIVARAGHGG